MVKDKKKNQVVDPIQELLIRRRRENIAFAFLIATLLWISAFFLAKTSVFLLSTLT